MQELRAVSLDEVLAYTNSDVVYRFKKSYGLSIEEATDIFAQVRRWMWLAHTRKLEGVKLSLSIDPSLIVIDEMWHNFILFTKEYHEFCHTFFGYYMHHAPATEMEDSEFHATKESLAPEALRKKIMDEKRVQYEYVYDKLGKETFQKWYVEYPKKYTPVTLTEGQFRTMEATVNKARALREQAMAEVKAATALAA